MLCFLFNGEIFKLTAPLWQVEFARTVIKKYNMDDSHSEDHFNATREWARRIITSNEFSDLTFIQGFNYLESENIILDAAFCHDLIDKKYMDEQTALEDLKKVFIQNGYSEEMLTAVVYIITHCSFSKRVLRKKEGLPMIEEGPYKLVTQIVVDADQIDAYSIARLINYQKEKFKHEKEPERSNLIFGWMKTIIEKRILKYIDEYMNTEIAKQISRPFHRQLEKFSVNFLKTQTIFEYI